MRQMTCITIERNEMINELSFECARVGNQRKNFFFKPVVARLPIDDSV